ALIAPVKMKVLLQDLLRTQDKLKLIELESSSTPLTLPGNPQADAEQRKTAPLTFYRHGLRLTLEGGYFELLTYLNAIQARGWRLHWDSLDYEVGEAGAGRARIILDLHTLTRDAGRGGVEITDRRRRAAVPARAARGPRRLPAPAAPPLAAAP